MNIKNKVIDFWKDYVAEYNGVKFLAILFLVGGVIWYIGNSFWRDLTTDYIIELIKRTFHVIVGNQLITITWVVVACNLTSLLLYVELNNTNILRRIRMKENPEEYMHRYRKEKIKKITTVKACVLYLIISAMLIIFIHRMIGGTPLLCINKIMGFNVGVVLLLLVPFTFFYSSVFFLARIIETNNFINRHMKKLYDVSMVMYISKKLKWLKIPIVNPIFLLLGCFMISCFCAYEGRYLPPLPLSSDPKYENCIDDEHRYQFIYGHSGYGMYLDQGSYSINYNSDSYKAWSEDIVTADVDNNNNIIDRKTLYFEIINNETYVTYKERRRKIDVRNTEDYNMLTRKSFLHGYWQCFRLPNGNFFPTSENSIIDF